MNKHNLIKKLAQLFGLKLEYFDSLGNLIKVPYNDCLRFLEIIGINIEEIEDIDKFINDIEFNKWNRLLPEVQVVKKSSHPIIHIRISSKDLNKNFQWIIYEENGQVHQGNFSTSDLNVSTYKSFKKIGNFLQLDFQVPFDLNIGYHQFKIKDSTFKESTMNLIITPEKCYFPAGLKRNKKIIGPKINFESLKSIKLANYHYLFDVIKQLSNKKADTIGIGSINKLYLNLFESVTHYLPSSRRVFDFIYIDIDELMNFLEEKSVHLELLKSQYNEEIKKLQDHKKINYKDLYDLKIPILKEIYQSFREYHIKFNSPISQEFNYFINQRREPLRKLAIFEALQEYFNNELPESISWHDWPENYQNPYSETIKQFETNNIEWVQFYEFLQWIADIQLRNAALKSFERQLSVGITVDLKFGIDPNGSDAWLNQHIYASEANARLFESNNQNNMISGYSPLLPHKLKETSYKYFIESIRANMIHSGALSIFNLAALDTLKWSLNDNNNNLDLFIEYPFEDLISIIALESQKNNCIIVTEDYKTYPPRINQAINKYMILTKKDFNLTEVKEEEDLKEFLTVLQPESSSENFLTNINILESGEYHVTKIPDATYRFQFNQHFTFNHAKELIPYLKNLGISHCYASPLLCSRPNSMHGYDIIDHNSFNHSLGSKEDFYDLVHTLHKHNMGLIVDIVPNHMGISKENEWWMDVLENGPASVYASYFDIDWKPIKPELAAKVLVPILGDHYGNILSNGELNLKFDKETGKLKLFYYEHEFPINASSYPLILEHRIDVLASRLGSFNEDFHEYQSIITEYQNLPGHTETNPDKLKERIREKNIACKRLSKLCLQNYLVYEFISENLKDFHCQPGDTISHRRMHVLLEQQAYRLAYWRVSCDEINYRRFFDVNDLAGICVDNPLVFTNTHNFILELIEERKISGLRIDHPDGLFNPTEYFYRLQSEISKKLDIDFNVNELPLCGSSRLPFYIVVEKILAPFEKISENWAVHGTVGYEFLNATTNLFIDKSNEKKFDKIYFKFIGSNTDFQELVIQCKKLIMKTSLTGELNVLSNYINKISEVYYISRDYTLNSLKDALVEIIANFPVYRTYISNEEKSNKDIDYIKWAVGLAKKRSMSVDPSIYDFIEKVLLVEFEEDKESPYYKQILEFAMKFQQYTGPLMAKGLEDTCFYRYNRLIALNEVGGEPHNFGISINEFHHENINRQNTCPYNMLTTSTHDTKRSEDVRNRISVLSEIPDKWQKAVNRWSQLNKTKKTVIDKTTMPDKNDEYLFYQTLIGIWPGGIVDQNELNIIIDRIENYMIKAIREAKVHTSWVNINVQYEEAICNFIKRILTASDKHPFWKEFVSFQQDIILAGYINSLAQSVLKFTCPGVPDIYQGTEIWNLSLVDPDNRRLIDSNNLKNTYEKIKPLLPNNEINSIEDLKLFEKLLLPLDSGAMKMFITAATLNFRRQFSTIFKKGKYMPIETSGPKAENIVAFARVIDNEAIITVLPRLIYHMISFKDALYIKNEMWGKTKIILPKELKEFKFKNIYTRSIIQPHSNEIEVKNILDILPVAVIYANKKD